LFAKGGGIDPQEAENSPYPPKLYEPPKIRRKKFGLAGYQPNFDEELAAGKIPAKIRLIVKKLLKTFCIICIFAVFPQQNVTLALVFTV